VALALFLFFEEAFMEMTWGPCHSNMSDLWVVTERFARDHNGRVPTKTEFYAWAARKRIPTPTGCVMGDYIWESREGPSPRVVIHCRWPHGLIQRQVSSMDLP